MSRLLLLTSALLAGCAHTDPDALPAFPEKKPEPGEEARMIPRGLRYPVIAGGNGFVVLRNPLNLEEGHRGSVYREGRPVGRVRLSGPRTGSSATADITAGEARPGDEWEPDP